ncbi:MAG: DUF2341 domain-containing protein, partial [Lachnospiraceae bacterium]|nr:DUF2341 domain-containing protein [Lachnospiraceae bacterium]
NLVKQYNGSYVDQINGSVIPKLSEFGLYAIPITYSSEPWVIPFAFNNTTLFFTIERQPEMNENLSDIRFLINNEESALPYYIESSNSTHFNVYIKTHLLSGKFNPQTNNLEIMMYYGLSDLQPMSDANSVFAYYIAGPINLASGFQNVTHYNGMYTTIEFNSSVNSSSFFNTTYIRLNNSTNITNIHYAYLFRGAQGGTVNYFDLISYWDYASSNQLIHTNMNLANNTHIYIKGYQNTDSDVIRASTNIQWINSSTGHIYLDYDNSTDWDGASRYFSGLSTIRLGPGTSNTLNLSNIKIYNSSSNYTYTFGNPINLSVPPVPVSLDIPSGVFSSLNYTNTERQI